MSFRNGTAWTLAWFTASSLLVLTVHGQQHVAADFLQVDAVADEVDVEVKQTPKPPRAVPPRSADTTQPTTQSSGGESAAADNTPMNVSPEMADYLERTLAKKRAQIAALSAKEGEQPAVPATGDTSPSPSRGRRQVTKKQFAHLIDGIDQAETALARLQAANGQNPPAGQSPQVRILLDSPYVGNVYLGRNENMRFFAGQLVFTNPTEKPVVVKRSDVQLNADGKAYKSGTLNARVKSYSYSSGNRSVYMGNLKFEEEVTVPAGGNGSIWVAFDGLPYGGNVPRMTIDLKLSGRPVTFNVNEFTREMMGLTVERIGPRGSLGLLTIEGSMNAINVGGMVDELDKLTLDKVARVVIRWDKTAPTVESQTMSWLQQSAYQAGRVQRNNNNQFPIIPAAIRELHLAQLPKDNGSTRYYSPYGQNEPSRMHKTDQEAVTAAMQTAYETLTRYDLLQEIEKGHPLTRVAALEAGGGRLSTDDLPLVLEYAEGENRAMRRAALVALRHFGEQASLDALTKQAQLEKDPLAMIAADSLAGSRYAAAHRALLDLLKESSPELKNKLMVVVARHPRPIWGDLVYEFATAGDAQVNIVAMQALVNIGHPRLFEVLRDALESESQPLRDAAFRILVSRTDRESEDLAMEHTLKFIEESPPTSEMLQLLQRTRDRRAVKPLVKHFEKFKSNRSSLIQTLALIGDQFVMDVLLEHYPALNESEKSMVLNMLRQFRSPKFRELAGEALVSKSSSLVSAACQGLQEDGSREAVALLVEAYPNTTNTSAMSYISNALSYLGTSEARAALEEGVKSKDNNRRNYSRNALQNMRQRSPGYQYIYMGQQFDRQKKWKEAIEQYSLAAQIDDNLPEAYSGRGNALLRQEKFKEAAPDLEKALKLDPYNSMTITGLGIARVMLGKTDDGIKLVEENRKTFESDPTYAYNAACLYGRALETVKKDMKAEDRDKKIAEYQKQALEDLKKSLQLGFGDRPWAQKDPDLKSLHELDEFKKIFAGDPAEEKETKETAVRRGVQVEQIIEAVPAIP